MKLTASLEGLKEVQQGLKGFSDRRLAASAATALTRTAVDVKAGVQKQLPSVFDRPTPYTVNSLFVARATPEKLESEVGFKDSSTVGGRLPASRYLMPGVKGGPRRLKAFEKALARVGALPAGRFAVPGRGLQLDQHGNIPLGALREILAHLKAHSGKREKRNLTTARRLRSAQKKIGGKYIVISDEGEGLSPGIWRKGAGRDDVKPVVLFVRPPRYSPRFDFEGIAIGIVSRTLGPQIRRALDESIARLRARV